jgi:MFS family permease
MRTGLKRAIWWLGACQCVFWGVLYYGFAVVLVPIERDLDASRAAVAGAFSLGLLVMALAAPMVGRALDRGHGGRLIRGAAALAVTGLGTAATSTTLPMLYLAWGMLGLAMAGLLYESAFALVVRAVRDDAQRLRALAAVTVMGGLASTVFLPVLGWVTQFQGWRASLWVGALAVAAAAFLMHRLVLPAMPPVALAPATVPARPSRRDRRLVGLLAVFVTATLASMAVTSLLVAWLTGRGVSGTTAASVLAMLGIAQLPGRIWLIGEGRTPSPAVLSSLPLLLQATGLAGLALAPGPLAAALWVAVFGLGAGLHTLARPWIVQRLYGVAEAGYWNGQLARVQGLGRAAGPVLAVGLADLAGVRAVLLVAGAALLVLVPVARWLVRDPLAMPSGAALANRPSNH